MTVAYVTFPGTSGNKVTTTAFDIAGDLDITLDIAADDYGWTGAIEAIADNLDSGNSAGFKVGKTWNTVSGELQLVFYDGGGTLRTVYSAAKPAAANGTRTVLRVTYDVSAGTVTFYENGVVLGSPVASGFTGLNSGNTNPFTIGSTVGNAEIWDGGDIYSVEVKDDSTVVRRFDADDLIGLV